MNINLKKFWNNIWNPPEPSDEEVERFVLICKKILVSILVVIVTGGTIFLYIKLIT